jgi:hypothetical protein
LSLQESSICIDELLRLKPLESALFRQQRSFTTPSRLLNCFREKKMEKFSAGIAAAAVVAFASVSCWYIYTYINVANGNTTWHDCGCCWMVREGIVVDEF